MCFLFLFCCKVLSFPFVWCLFSSVLFPFTHSNETNQLSKCITKLIGCNECQRIFLQFLSEYKCYFFFIKKGYLERNMCYENREEFFSSLCCLMVKERQGQRMNPIKNEKLAKKKTKQKQS